MKKLDPKDNHQDKITFLSKFPWKILGLNNEQKAVVRELLVEFSGIFAKHRFDVGYNTNFIKFVAVQISHLMRLFERNRSCLLN